MFPAASLREMTRREGRYGEEERKRRKDKMREIETKVTEEGKKQRKSKRQERKK